MAGPARRGLALGRLLRGWCARWSPKRGRHRRRPSRSWRPPAGTRSPHDQRDRREQASGAAVVLWGHRRGIRPDGRSRRSGPRLVPRERPKLLCRRLRCKRPGHRRGRRARSRSSARPPPGPRPGAARTRAPSVRRRSPPWAPTPGQQEDRARHQLAHARQALGAGGARPPRPTSDSPQSPTWPAPTASTSSASRSCSGAPPASRSWRSAAPGFEVFTSRKQPAPARRGRLDQRLERVAAQQGVGGERVGAEAGHLAERPGRGAHQRLGVGGGGDRHVAALAVGQHQQAVLARRVARGGQRRPPGRAEALEAGELELHGHARRPRRLDGGAAVARHARRRCAPPGCPPPRLRPSGHSAAGSGSRPSTTRLRRSSTSAASRSAKCAGGLAALDGLLQRATRARTAARGSRRSGSARPSAGSRPGGRRDRRRRTCRSR